MKLSRSVFWTGHDGKSWPVLLLLLVVVLVPTVGVLWFMSQAMRNEQLAVRQKLTDIYQAQLEAVQQKLQLHWQERSMLLEALDRDAAESSLSHGSQVFAAGVREGLADSIVVYDTSGRLAYPAPPPLLDADLRVPSSGWRRVERLERSGQSAAAADGYAAIAQRATDRNLAARALQAQARCLVQAKLIDAAVVILIEELGRPEYDTAVDAQGRLIAPSAALRALQLLEGASDPRFRRIAAQLVERLNNYDRMVLPAAQRRFLMNQLNSVGAGSLPLTTRTDTALTAASPTFDTLAAEQLAERYLASEPPVAPNRSLRPSGLPEVWHLASPSGTVVALFNQQHLVEDLESLIAPRSLQESATIRLLTPGEAPDDLFLVSLPVGGFLQDWQLVLQPQDQTLFATATSHRIKAYLVTGGLVVAVIVILTLLVARAVTEQLRLTRLKNDLLSNVSHELKTPLASMRLLVDTLLETGTQDSQRVHEYLQLIAKENVRLSRLVDNFLSFSRMEQNRQSFERRSVRAETVVDAAVASVAERFRASDCRFEVEMEGSLPTVWADADALVTVLVNLLDNAFKYSEENRQIVLRCYREKDALCFAVRDNGIGLSSRVAGKIFDRFYQVDQSLSRPGSGCGLGLSIVRFIVDAHGGSVSVDSRLGEGSTFTVSLPLDPDVHRDADTQGEPREPEDLAGGVLDAQ